MLLTNENWLPIMRIPSEVMPTEDIQLQQQLDCGKQKQMGLIHTREEKNDEKALQNSCELLRQRKELYTSSWNKLIIY